VTTDTKNDVARPPQAASLGKVFNLPNQLTSLRLLLAIVLFVVVSYDHYFAGFILFVIASGTDWLDGYYARKYGQVTTLGRILDPFADKVIVCGTFIFLLAAPGMSADLNRHWLLPPAVVVIIVGRELLVTALRSFLEERGSDFSAKMSGKLKMVLQCVGAGACLFYLDYATSKTTGMPSAPDWIWWFATVSIWAATALTVYSGVAYIFVAVRLLRRLQRP
jgi:CDP-diacylglycerol---glycerol-3-phosphate 3-phosphatidyltransferase